MSDEIERSENEPQQPDPFEPDFSDSTIWIAVHTPELIRIGRGNDEGKEVLSGQMLVSYRRRKPEDGDAPSVLERPVSTVRPDVEEKITWPTWGEPRGVDPRVAKYDPPRRDWSLNRNSGCLRADGSVEP